LFHQQQRDQRHDDRERIQRQHRLARVVTCASRRRLAATQITATLSVELSLKDFLGVECTTDNPSMRLILSADISLKD
jgi:hypothetical protein